jgi:pyruvate dehydrogenase E1 component beta subunit
MTRLQLAEAINRTLREEMARDERILLLGEDVGRSGGVFRVTKGLQEEFGVDRVVDTPVSEAGIIGAAVGLCLSGLRPVCELQFESFSYPALNQIITHVSRYRWRTLGACTMPMVIRIPIGGGVRAPELHSDSPEAYFCHTPGLYVVEPSTPADASGLLTSALRGADPVIFFEPKALYRQVWGDVPDGDNMVPLRQVRIARAGSDVTLLCWGPMVAIAIEAAELLERDGISCLICDIRTLAPLDDDGVLSAVRATGRVVVIQESPRNCSLASELVALVAESAIFDLLAPPVRVSGFDVPHPYASIEHLQRPTADRVAVAVRSLWD